MYINLYTCTRSTMLYQLPSRRELIESLSNDRRRRRLQKRNLKRELAPLQILLRLFHRVKFDKCWRTQLQWNAEGPYRSSGKENENRCLAFSLSTKRGNILSVSLRSRATTAKKCMKEREACPKLMFC